MGKPLTVRDGVNYARAFAEEQCATEIRIDSVTLVDEVTSNEPPAAFVHVSARLPAPIEFVTVQLARSSD